MSTGGLPPSPITWYWLVILFLAVDLAYYWAHRMSHEVNIFWIGHVVHHQSEEYNLSVALRQGALQKIFTSFFYLPLAIVGFSVEYFLLLAAFNTLYQFWIHTEAIRSLGPLEWIFNTPSHHRVHHGRNPEYIDRNHAGVFIIWDKMFGTFKPEKQKVVYGITTPTQCWDPVTSHMKPFTNLWNDWKTVKEWRFRLQLLFMKPGWLPKKYGGYREPKQVQPNTYQKFETTLSRSMNIYLLVHFVLILTGTSFFLFSFEALSQVEQVIFTLLISLSVMATGFLFEGKSWAPYAEAFRLLIVASVLVFFFQDMKGFSILGAFFSLVVITSLYALYRFSYLSPLQTSDK